MQAVEYTPGERAHTIFVRKKVCGYRYGTNRKEQESQDGYFADNRFEKVLREG